MSSPRRFPTALLAGALAILSVVSARAQESFSMERNSPEATALVEKYQALAGDDPALADAVEAVLFPFTREDATTAEPEATPAPPPPAEEKTLFFIRGPGGVLTAVRAESFEKDKEVLIIATTSGSKAIHQSSNVAGELPWYSDADLASGAVDVEELAGKYEAVAARAPTLRRFLEAEAARIRANLKKQESEDSVEDDGMAEKVAAITAAAFDPDEKHTVAGIVARLREAEVVITEFPASAPDLDAWAVPYREHLAHLLAGDEWTDGKWVTAAERREREEREKSEKFRGSIGYSMKASVVPGDVVRSVLMRPLWIAVGLVVLAIGALVFWRKPLVQLGAVVVIVAVPILGAFLFFLASRDAVGMPTVSETANEKPVVDLVASANHGGGSPTVVKQDDLNAFLARRIRLRGGDGDGLSRQGLAVDLSPGRVAVFELIRGFGFEWIVRFDFAWLVENGKPSLEATDVTIGRLPCPPALGNALLASVESELGAVLEQTGVLRAFSPEAPEIGGIALSPRSSGEESAETSDSAQAGTSSR